VRQNSAALIDVTVPSRNGRIRRAGIRVHRSGRLGAEEVTARDGIPVTTLARTLLDLADVLHPQALKRAITEAEYRQRISVLADDSMRGVREAWSSGAASGAIVNALFGAALIPIGVAVLRRRRWAHPAMEAACWASVLVLCVLAPFADRRGIEP